MKKVSGLILILFLLMATVVVQGQGPIAQQTNSSQHIHLRTATFDPLAEGEPVVATRFGAMQDAGPYYLVQFNGPVEAVWIQQLEQLGAEVLGYIPDNTHLVQVQPEDVEKVKSMYAVRWLGPYRAGYKLAPELNETLKFAGETQVYVLAFPGESPAELEAFLAGLGGKIDDAAETDFALSFRVTIPTSVLPEIARHPAVSWVEPYVPFELENAEGRKIMNVENIWQTRGYFGQGQIVAVSDTGLSWDPNDTVRPGGQLNADFAGRMRRVFPPSEMNLQSGSCAAKTNWTDLDGHGTHVSGSVLGNGTNSGSNAANHSYTGSHAGNAPEAELVFMAVAEEGGSLGCISSNGSFIAKGYEEGARISSNSWGADTGGAYDGFSSLVDNYIWNHKDYLVLFAAGNSGPGTSTVGAPGTAKNIVTVGASENNRPNLGSISDNPDTMANFSSRGPTADNRIKPDIVAPGTNIISVRGERSGYTPFQGNSNYAAASGTSMATPLTGGASAVLREWLQKERNVSTPSAALMKALLIQGAYQLPGTAIPNSNSGWGRVDLKNTLNSQYAIFDDHVQGLTTGQVISYTIQVVGSSKNGVLFAGNSSDPGPGAADSLTIASSTPVMASRAAITGTAKFSLEPVPGLNKAIQSTSPIRVVPDQGKKGLTPASGLIPPPVSPKPASVVPVQSKSSRVPESTLIEMIEGGDWEDPELWSIWLGFGVPVVTDGTDGGIVLNGNYSVWLGGTESNDSIWYPISFPDSIDTGLISRLEFTFAQFGLDPTFDYFCVGLTDVSGFLIGPYAEGAECYDNQDEGVSFVYTFEFSNADLAAFEGQTGYLVFFTDGDAIEPHMSTFVDDISLLIDFPDPTLNSTPSSGPPGTTFLLTGNNNTPYGAVDFCIGSCPAGYLGTVFADAKGDVASYLFTEETASPGPLTIESRDANNRPATTDITLTGGGSPNLTVTPSSAQAGSQFVISGTNFLPNDANIAITINGDLKGTVGSDTGGAIAFNIQTSSNTPAGTYTVQATDSANRSATTSFQVTAVSGGNPTMSVSPLSGPPGTAFTFNGNGFSPNTDVDFSLDGQSLGTTAADGAGEFQVQLTTGENIAPGTYTLIATQGNNQASAQFQITDSGGGTLPSGQGIHITLVWVDPPAQAAAAVTMVNNLNLRVEGPGGPYHGNGGSGPDSRNNVETIRLENPSPGAYTIYVEAASVNGAYGAQPYALVATTAQNFGTNSTTANLDLHNKVYLPVVVK